MGFRNSSQFETNALESKENFAKYLKPGLTKNSTKIRIGNTSYLQHRLLLNLVFLDIVLQFIYIIFNFDKIFYRTLLIAQIILA